MHHRPGILILYAGLVLAAALAACATYPTAVSPVPQDIPTCAADYPPDAVFAARAIFAAMQGRDLRGATIDQQTAAGLVGDFAFPGFHIDAHRLLEYRAREDGPTGRYASGIVSLRDAHGRSARFMYSALYDADRDGLRIDAAETSAVYTHSPAVRVMLVPDDHLPAENALPDSWDELFTLFEGLDAMPAGGITAASQLEGHHLAIFVMDRTPAGADVALTIDIADIIRLDPAVTLSREQYRDFYGWRVAVLRPLPRRMASLSEAPPCAD
ncbi:hypothetical protein GGQ74_002262 [Desulfobaculum xiamenense]|uniref:Uncharacterized protein n=1 Tax=Desulfobaculum xiamenense TaxID=995050 RepID=A0A846QVB8_9BACT|nr:hypothetical protein [Desulfobaculum xiamenense]NJB68589.1 hypothetical protein [Desulfobaculum xiamenense]